jgi:broad specificity phosphatase PhoE
MSHLILIKHSLPEIDPGAPANEWRLSDEGKTRCSALADRLKAWSPQVLVASAEPKAVQTAELVARRLVLPCSVWTGLHEHERTGAAFLDRAQFEMQVTALFEHPQRLVFGRETASQALARFSTALAGVEREYPGKNIAVITHGMVITLFVSRFNAIQPFTFWKQLGLPSFVVLSLPEHRLVDVVEAVE